MTKERIAIIDGARSPFAKSWTTLNGLNPVELSTMVARELLFRNEIRPEWVDHIVWGTVVSVPRAPNVAREVALNLNLYQTPGFTVSRACATGLQSIASVCEMIWAGTAQVALAGGVDVTSDAPVPHKKEVIDKLQSMGKKKGWDQLKTIASLRPKDLFPVAPTISEPYTGKTMGEHAEEMAQNFSVSRKEQEDFAILSHAKAHKATEQGLIESQLIHISNRGKVVSEDNLIRPKMDPERLKKMRPAFDKKHGTITAATSSALTDGAACVLMMSESRAKELGYTPIGFVRSYSFSALDPRENMLLGNVYACPEALKRAGCTLKDIDILDIHEAFAAQLLSNLRCFDSASFFAEKMPGFEPLGEVDPEKLNIWGGSLAYGHPFAATGGRLVTNALHALRHTDGQLGLVSACAAGGLGSAMILERA